MTNLRVTRATCAFALLFGCATDPGTKPRDMSASRHEEMANQEERAAEGHDAQHDPSAIATERQCAPKVGCWTSTSNPTAQHSKDAERHRELAQKHRTASAALVEVEKRACADIPEADRDISPFSHREDIESVSPLFEEVRTGKAVSKKEVGATVVFRAVPGLTAEWLQRVVDCHLARASAVGFEMPEMSYCPLALKGVKAKVSSTGNGFAIDVSADDSATIAEIKKRAEAAKKNINE